MGTQRRSFPLELKARSEMIAVGKRMYEKGFIVASDGNLSVRLGPNRFLVTGSGVCKGELKEKDLVLCDERGRIIRGGRVSSEILLHLTAYHLRPDINAVIHAHPPFAIAFTLTNRSLAEAVLPEVVMSLGNIPTTLFAAPASPEGAEVIKTAILNHDAIILDRHGSLTVGKDLWDAYYKLERLEFAAKVIQAAYVLGEPKTLTQEELAQVQRALERYRGGNEERCPHCGHPLRKQPPPAPKAYSISLRGWQLPTGKEMENLVPLMRHILEDKYD